MMSEETNTEKQPMNSSAKIILTCTILLVVVLSATMLFMWKNIRELSLSPLTIGAQKISDVNNGADVSCSCRVGRGLSGTIYFNTTSVWNDRSQQIGFNLNSTIAVVENGSG